jgi:hypothetical protein
MEDRATRLDTFLDLDDRQILDNASRSPKPGPTSTP